MLASGVTVVTVPKAESRGEGKSPSGACRFERLGYFRRAPDAGLLGVVATLEGTFSGECFLAFPCPPLRSGREVAAER